MHSTNPPSSPLHAREPRPLVRSALAATVAIVAFVAIGAVLATRDEASAPGSPDVRFGRVERGGSAAGSPQAPAPATPAAGALLATPVAGGGSPAPTPALTPAPDAVLYVDPAGDDRASGSAEAPLRTVHRALALAQPGAAVRLRAGVYSEEIETVRAGEPARPIVIESAPGARAVIDGRAASLNAPRLVHSYVTLRGLEIRDTREGVRIEHAEGAVLSDNEIHHVDNECVRLRFSTRNARVERNVIHHCGLRGNGEGIYVGVAPEQRAKNGGIADSSTGNAIAHNELYAVQEGIDVKEDATGTSVVANTVHDATDPNSGGINVRGDDNYVAANRSIRNAGAGFRVGGDLATHPVLGPGHRYGTHNTFVDNIAEGNAGHGYKFMTGPQLADCSNTGAGNGGRLYYFDETVAPFIACP